MITKVFHSIFSYGKKSLGVILFISCSFAIYHTVLSNENWFQYTSILRNLLMEIPFYQWLLLFLLMLANFMLESIKWKMVVSGANKIDFVNAVKGVLVGQTFAFFTPNRIGEYAGRTLYLSAGNKLMGVAQLAWASYAQLLVTITMGSIALAINLKSYAWINGPLLVWVQWGIPVLGILAVFLFFNTKQWGGKLQFLNRVQIETRLKVDLCWLSFVRYGIFLLQYIWVANMLKMNMDTTSLLLSISTLFLFLSIVPTISITELVIRGQLLLMIMAPIYDNKMAIISLSSLIWGVNFLIPSIIGAFLLLGYRINR